MNKARLIVGYFLLAGAIMLLGSALSWGQTSGEITGIVTDATKAVIPGVEVVATNTGTGISRNALSESTGLYRIPLLSPGTYTVKASMTGFKTAVREGITLTVGQVARVDLVLEVGNIAETVTVSGEASPVDTEQGRVSTLVDSKRILDMPLNGRNIYTLMTLAPGAVNTQSTDFEPGAGTAENTSSVNGGRANFNGFWLDGVSNTGLSGGTNLTPNVDAIQEFRMETMNFSAEFGANAGSVVNVVSKSGTNSFHGTAYEFLRNDAADAAEYFDPWNPDTNSKDIPPYKRNMFGGSVGGPIVKNHLFFFGSYQGLRVRTGNSLVNTFESPQWANYVQQYGAPVAQFLYKNYPATRPLTSITSNVGDYLTEQGWIGEPTQAEVDSFLGSTFGSPAGALAADAPMIGDTSYFLPDPSEENQYSLRIDEEFRGGKDKLSARYFQDTFNGQIVTVEREAFSSPQQVKAIQPSVSETHIFSPAIVNEFRFGLNRNRNDIYAGDPGVPAIGDGYAGTSYFGAYNGYPQFFTENVYSYSDVVNITKGKHGMKTGVEFRRNQENSTFDVGRPSYYFYGLVYIALDDPYYQAAGVNPNLVSGSNLAELDHNNRGWRNTEFGAFFNDDWKILPNLSLNLGVRYDLYTRLTEVQNRTTQYVMNNGDNLWYRVENGYFDTATALSAGDHNNFAPRIGFAWDPFKDGKTSVRGGYGIAYQAGVYNPLANSRWDPPFYSFNGILLPSWGGVEGSTILYGPQTPGQAVTSTGPNPNPGAQLYEGNIMAYYPENPNTTYLTGIANPRMRDPYVESWFFGIQRELLRDVTLEVNYVGTAGRKIIRAENWNRFNGDRLGYISPVGTGEGDTSLNRLNSTYGTMRFWENSVTSSYNALQAQVSKRFTKGYALTANYTWAHSIDLRSTWHSGATSSNGAQEGYSTDVEDIRLDRGRSIFDARHRFVVNGIWDLPLFANSSTKIQNLLGGWQVNGILSLQSGQPFTPFIGTSFSGGGDWNGDGTNNDRPNTPSIGNSITSDRSSWINPASGPFNIPTTNPSGVPTLAEKEAFFGVPELGTTGTLGRNTYEGPGFANVDFSVFKNIKIPQINEQSMVQVRFEFFNMFNRINFYQPTPTLNSSTFGTPTQTFDARQIQFGIKFIF
jgi:hypothetical protein